MRARNLKPGFFKNEMLAELDPLVRILFAGLWGLADRDGRLEDRPKRIKAEVLPYDDCDVDAMLQVLADSPEAFIVRYSVDGRSFIEIPAFHDHQAPHYKEAPSEIPPYAGELNHRPIIGQSSVDSDPLNPESGILNPESKKSARAKKQPEEMDGAARWVAEWTLASEEAGIGTPGKRDKDIFGAAVKRIADLDPAIMRDAIARMVTESKGPQLADRIYGDCKRATEEELFRMRTEVRRVR